MRIRNNKAQRINQFGMMVVDEALEKLQGDGNCKFPFHGFFQTRLR